MPIRDEAINVFMGLPGDGDRLELTYNHGVDSYELGTGYNHIALTVDDLDATLERLGRAGHRAREAAVPRARGRLAHRASCAIPDGYRIELIETRLTPGRRPSAAAVIDLGSNSFRLVVFTAGRRAGGSARTRSTSRCASARAWTRPARCSAEPMERALETLELFAHFCRADRDRRRSARSPRRRSATPPTGRRSCARRASARGPRGRGAARARRRPATATSRRSTRRRSPTASCSTSAAARCSSSRVARPPREVDARSWPLGAVRMTERFLPGDERAKRKQLKALREHVAARARATRRGSPDGGRRLVGVGGTVRNLAAAAQLAAGLPSYGVQGFVIDRATRSTS